MFAVVQFSLTEKKHPVFVADGNENRVRVGKRIGTIHEWGGGWYAHFARHHTYTSPAEASARELREWVERGKPEF